jgi:hypothetical protein
LVFVRYEIILRAIFRFFNQLVVVLFGSCLAFAAVDRRVGLPRNNGPELLERIGRRA